MDFCPLRKFWNSVWVLKVFAAMSCWRVYSWAPPKFRQKLRGGAKLNDRSSKTGAGEGLRLSEGTELGARVAGLAALRDADARAVGDAVGADAEVGSWVAAVIVPALAWVLRGLGRARVHAAEAAADAEYADTAEAVHASACTETSVANAKAELALLQARGSNVGAGRLVLGASNALLRSDLLLTELACNQKSVGDHDCRYPKS